jgi:carboxylate-amine ligase
MSAVSNQRPSLNIGIEEEYQTVDPVTRDLRSHINAEIVQKGRMILEERVKPEMHQSVVEIGTGICKNIKEANDEVRMIRQKIITLARQNGLRLAAGGTHPFAQWREQEIYPDDRYRVIVEDLKMVARANLIFGLHVHIGVEDRETADSTDELARAISFPICWRFRRVPHSGLAWRPDCDRTAARCSTKFPRTNIPDLYSSWSEFENYVNLLIHTNCIDNAKKIWWDIRPHPYFPTIGISRLRYADAPGGEHRDRGACARLSSPNSTVCTSETKASATTAARSSWRTNGGAARYGLDGKMIDFGKQTEAPARQLIVEILEFVDDVVDELGSREESPTCIRSSKTATARTASCVSITRRAISRR